MSAYSSSHWPNFFIAAFYWLVRFSGLATPLPTLSYRAASIRNSLIICANYSFSLMLNHWSYLVLKLKPSVVLGPLPVLIYEVRQTEASEVLRNEFSMRCLDLVQFGQRPNFGVAASGQIWPPTHHSGHGGVPEYAPCAMLAQAVAGALAGCVGCQAGVEMLQKEVKDSLNLLTLATCVFVSLEGLIFHRMLRVKQEIPTRVYLKIVCIFFFVNFCNNYAIKCDVYFPLFIIFKSGSLLANIIFGYTLRGHSYTTREIFSVFIVTGGIVIFTLASYERKPSTSASALHFFGIPPFFIGVALLTVALMLSAYLGVCQEDMYREHGKHAKESMFMVVHLY
ncbi:hypothetical protein Y032_0002g1038 [Ancylostoma ceylanicum]|uniref:UAA transporter family protein n=2 Tax=Ancylostoma ceylanicum TaxID=53326 RepID=A0A016W0Z9_9BILA|nr:hypothetical protein Y032_0002g1038 [Ancylostoma ceylanicum]